MIYRSALLLITVFWVTMNVLLWRAEYGQRQAPGSPVPAELVWQKMLTAPDSSSLSILQSGKKVGFCHWITSVGEDLSKVKEGDVPPEGMVNRVADYRIQLEGNVAWPAGGQRTRFDGTLKLNNARQWQEMKLRLNLRDVSLELESLEAQRTIAFRLEEGNLKSQRVFKFSDFENPQALLRQFMGPVANGLLGNLGLSEASPSSGPLRLGLNWEARHDTIKIAHSTVRTYRLQTRLLDRYQIVIIVSRVGEILRVELPNELVLINDQLATF